MTAAGQERSGRTSRFFDRRGRELSQDGFLALLGERDYRRLARERVGGLEVVTIWQGAVDEETSGPLPLFETLVVAGEAGPELVATHTTEAEAEAGHRRVVDEVRARRGGTASPSEE